MSGAGILLVEADILVRSPLAEYLRECGYKVLESGNASEARELLEHGEMSVDLVMIDVSASDREGFELAVWARERFGCRVVLAGTTAKAVEKSGDLCQESPAIAKPYDHQLVLNEIRRNIAARDRVSKGA